MPEAPPPTLQDRLAGALDWWREAGVDHTFADEPRSWVAKAEAPAAESETRALAEAPQLPQLGGDRSGWPTDLAAFQAWWLAEPSLDPGPLAERVAPRGPQGAPLAVVVEHPEREDSEKLLSGREGRLLDAFLTAAGLYPANAYVASALPRCTPLPDWTALHGYGLGKILAHQVELAMPERLILFGSNIPPLLGHAPAQNGPFLPPVNHGGRKVPVLVAPSLSAMLARPKLKRALWERWLDWSG